MLTAIAELHRRRYSLSGLLRHHGACFANEAERRIFCALSRCCLEVRSLSEVKTTLKSSSVGKALAEALSSTFGEAPKA